MLRGAWICQSVRVVIGGPRVVLVHVGGLEISPKVMYFLEIRV